jgi:hypothetical protein
VHCRAARAEDTDWAQIVRLYDFLERVQPSPVVSLNRAVAVAMASGPGAGLEIIDRLAVNNDLDSYPCCMPRARICCGGWGPRRRRLRAIGGRWSWRLMTASGGFWRGACGRLVTAVLNVPCGADLQVCAGPPGPAWADVDVGRRTGVPPHSSPVMVD